MRYVQNHVSENTRAPWSCATRQWGCLSEYEDLKDKDTSWMALVVLCVSLMLALAVWHYFVRDLLEAFVAHV
jgi:hypothetical protein